jgi:hypothetical protein
MPGLNVNKVFGIIPTLLLVNYWYFVVRISMSMVGTAYRTLDMRLWQELALHPWIQFSIVGGGACHFKVRAIFSTLQQQRIQLWTAPRRRWKMV